MFKNRVVGLLLAVLFILGGSLLDAPSSSATSKTTKAVIPVYSYELINVTTWQNWVDYSRRVGACSGSAGTTCVISSAKSVATTVTASLGAAASGISAMLGFSLSQTSSTTVSCTSPPLKAGQIEEAYSMGTEKEYRIQKYATNSAVNAPPPHLIATSGYVTAFQPYHYPAIYCTTS